MRELPSLTPVKHWTVFFQEAATAWGCKVSVLPIDNTLNTGIAMTTATIPVHVGCFAHTLNLAAGKAV